MLPKTSPQTGSASVIGDIPKNRNYGVTQRHNNRMTRIPNTPKYVDANPMILAEIAEVTREHGEMMGEKQLQAFEVSRFQNNSGGYR